MIARLDRPGRSRPVRYAVIGLGHIAQVAVLPAFRHARGSELAALVSDDPAKLKALGRKYGVEQTYTYDQLDDCFLNGGLDAVFIALPNWMHREYAERAARAGLHVLCEKPLAMTEEDCRAMIRAAEESGVKLMTAYRLHFEEGNLEAVKLATSGRLGDVRLFSSVFTMQVEAGNIRLQREGGGPLYDIGIYCVNASRYLFRAEPTEVVAFAENNGEPRFREVDEMVSAVLRFPGNRLAQFVCSFGAADAAEYRIVGTKGRLRVEPAYGYAEGIRHHLAIGDKETTRVFPKRDQFAAEIEYFTGCVLGNRDPEPSGLEGLADIRILEALQKSVATGRPVALGGFDLPRRPTPAQEIRRPPVGKTRHIHARSPHPKES